jgi:amino acid permease
VVRPFDKPPPTGLPATSSSEHDDDDTTQNNGGSASIPNLVTSLVKSIVGAGVLALPASIAGMAETGQASASLLFPAALVVLLMGGINAYFFGLIGRVCSMTRATSFQDAWDKTVGAEDGGSTPGNVSVVAVIITLKTVLSCLAFSIILADSFQSIAIASGLQETTRGQALFSVTGLLLLPLCTLIKDLNTLAPFSFLGLVGVGTTIVSMIVRCIDGSYGSGGAFASPTTISLAPSSFPILNFNAFGALVLACTLATAFVAHYNAPRFHVELENNTVERFDKVVGWSYMISGIMFMIVAAAGFLTFGSASSGFILNSYSPFDPLITISRVALAFSIALTYPLPFFGLRDGALDLLQIPQEKRSGNVTTLLSVGMLSGVTVAAYFVRDLALVLSVGGGSFSTIISAVFPTLMFRAAIQQRKSDSKAVSERDALDSKLSLGLMCISSLIGTTGVAIALLNAIK